MMVPRSAGTLYPQSIISPDAWRLMTLTGPTIDINTLHELVEVIIYAFRDLVLSAHDLLHN